MSQAAYARPRRQLSTANVASPQRAIRYEIENKPTAGVERERRTEDRRRLRPSQCAPVLRRAIAAIGGDERWRAVHTIGLAGRGLQNHVGDSEWFDGPFFVDYRAIVDWRDLDGMRRATRIAVTRASDTASFALRTVATLGGTLQLAGDSAAPSAFALAPDTLALLLAP